MARVNLTLDEETCRELDRHVRLQDGTVHTAELHRYEAHGVGRREMKIKFPLLD